MIYKYMEVSNKGSMKVPCSFFILVLIQASFGHDPMHQRLPNQ